MDKHAQERKLWRAEAGLVELGHVLAARDAVVISAHRAGVNKNRIHLLTGLARTTLDKILEGEPPE